MNKFSILLLAFLVPLSSFAQVESEKEKGTVKKSAVGLIVSGGLTGAASLVKTPKPTTIFSHGLYTSLSNPQMTELLAKVRPVDDLTIYYTGMGNRAEASVLKNTSPLETKLEIRKLEKTFGNSVSIVVRNPSPLHPKNVIKKVTPLLAAMTASFGVYTIFDMYGEEVSKTSKLFDSNRSPRTKEASYSTSAKVSKAPKATGE